jgi:hypothetical protein
VTCHTPTWARADFRVIGVGSFVTSFIVSFAPGGVHLLNSKSVSS